MMDTEKLEELRTMYDTLVDGVDCDLFNSIRYKISEANETLDALIDAELARQVPDGEVQAAERCVVELIREAHKRNNDSQYAHKEFIREYRDELRSAEKTVLAALRQFRQPEPCGWCRRTNVILSGKIGTVDMSKANFCPNCGRKLGGD